MNDETYISRKDEGASRWRRRYAALTLLGIVGIAMSLFAGHEVLTARDGEEVLDLLLRGEEVDVILMDIQMPHMDGYQTTAEIRAREKRTGGHIPIVAVTAHAMKGDRERILEAGMDGYLSKPIDADRLYRAVEDVVVVVEPETSTHDEPLFTTREKSDDI